MLTFIIAFDPKQVAAALPTEVEVQQVETLPTKERVLTTVSRPTGPSDVIALGRQVVVAENAEAAHGQALATIRRFCGNPGLSLMGRCNNLGPAEMVGGKLTSAA